MPKNMMDPKVFLEVYDQVSENSDKFREMIEKNAMAPEKIQQMIERDYSADARYPELANVEKMTSQEFAALYAKMAEDVKSDPQKFEEQARQFGMTSEELADLFTQISGGIEKYPEVWESTEKAQMLHPRNLAMLAAACREDFREAIEKIKGFEK